MEFLVQAGVNWIVAIQSLGGWLEAPMRFFYLPRLSGIFLPRIATHLLECRCGIGPPDCSHSCAQ